MFTKLFQILDGALRDNATGQYSSARIIAMLVAIAATIFMWKLILLGGMTIDYFIAYLAYGTGTTGINKFLDNRDGARQAQVNANIAREVNTPEEPPTDTITKD